MSHWSDIMPALDLGTEGCVPYRRNGTRFSTLPVNAGPIATQEGGKVEQPDLDHPQGFGWTLRWLGGQDHWEGLDLQSLLHRWVLWKTTEEDRLRLARACAMMAPR